MKMHSSKFKDPLISRAQPVTIISPIIEETLRSGETLEDLYFRYVERRMVEGFEWIG